MKSRIFDVILAMTIAVSGGFIGYRLLRGKNAEIALPPEAQQGPIRKARSEPGSPKMDVPILDPALRPTWKIGLPDAATLLLATKLFSSADWSSLKKQSPVGESSIFETEACKRTDANPIPAFPIFNVDMLAKFKKGEVTFFFDVQNRSCFRKNAVVPVYSLGRLMDEPFFSQEGTVEIDDIIRLQNDKTAEKILGLIVNLPPAKISELFTKVIRQSDGSISLLKFVKTSKPSNSEAQTLPYPTTPHGTTIRPARLKQYFQRHPDVIVVDVRSVSESNQQPLDHSGTVISVPYTVSKDAGNWNFNWKRTVGDVNNDTFDIAKVVNLRTSPERPIMIVGAAPSDGRPAWAIFELAKVNVRNLVWFYDGAAVFNTTIKEK